MPASPDPRLSAAAAMVFVEDPLRPRLEAPDVHHLFDVRRLRPGELVVAGDGAGRFVPCRVGAMERDQGRDDRSAALVVDGEPVLSPRPRPTLTVAFAPAKGDRPEWVTQKLTELGVDRIVVVRTRRTVVQWEGGRADRARDRLARVAREAAAQCRRPWLPEIAGPLDLDELRGSLGGPVAVARPGGGPPSLDRPAVVVGPEGGWEESEIRGFTSDVGLGPAILRSETAAVVAGALLCGLRSDLVRPLA